MAKWNLDDGFWAKCDARAAASSADERAARAEARLRDADAVARAQAALPAAQEAARLGAEAVAEAEAELERLRGQRVAGAEERITELRAALSEIAGSPPAADYLTTDRLDEVVDDLRSTAEEALEADDETTRQAEELPDAIEAAEAVLREARRALDAARRELAETERLVARAPELEAARAPGGLECRAVAQAVAPLRRENEVLRSNIDHLCSENASLVRQVESMAMRIESLAEELAKPEDVRLREVLDALDGRAVIFDGLGARVRHLLDEMDEWIERAGEAERLAEERLAHAHQLQADIEAEMQARLALRKRLGAREDETMGAFLERLATMAGVVPVDVHEIGWQWRPTGADTAFAPPFGTIRQCRVCGCLVVGGPTACARCAEAGA